MKFLLIALLSTLTMNANAHSILPLPSEEIESIKAINSVSELTYANFIRVNKVEANNLSCAEEAWAWGDLYIQNYQAVNGTGPSSQDVYTVTNSYYNNCVNHQIFTAGSYMDFQIVFGQ